MGYPGGLDALTYRLTGGRAGQRWIIAHGISQAVSLSRVLLEDANWPKVNVRVANGDHDCLPRSVSVRSHPHRGRRDFAVVLVSGHVASEATNQRGPITIAIATEAAVRLAGGAAIGRGLILEPLTLAEAEALVESRDRTRMVACECGGLQVRIPFIASWCWREQIDAQRRHRTNWSGKRQSRRQRVVSAIERLTFGLI